MNRRPSSGTRPLTTDSAAARVERGGRVCLLLHHRDGIEAISLAAGGSVVVGREPPADVVIPDECLSRCHVRFSSALDNEVTVEDLGSTNGTMIGGRRVDRSVVRPGEEVMLGSIAASLHVVPGAEANALALEGHDAFRRAAQAEIERARFFGRALAVVVVQPTRGEHGHLPGWCAGLRPLLRPVDRLALYGGSTVEALLPEVGEDGAVEVARALVARREGEPRLVAGVAVFPEAGTDVEALVDGAREAMRGADAATPVKLAAQTMRRTLVAPADHEQSPVLESPAMRALAQMIPRLARSAIPVLLQGETGAGKEVVARRIHEAGPRRSRPLVALNCGAIPGQLVEGALFGHEKGAFTGALQQQKGAFEAADGGTLLLDEIGELSAPAQAALLRVLETKRVVRVGATRELEVDVRVIAATHRDLETMCAAGTFRHDLFYRLSTMVLHVPPLRERPEDVAPLALRFLRLAATAEAAPMRGIDPEALTLLARHAWPGNVRELRNAIERAVVVADGERIMPRDLPERIRSLGEAPPSDTRAPTVRGVSNPAGGLRQLVERFERDIIIATLVEAGGNQSEAARRLELPLRTLQHKLKSHRIRKPYG